MTFMTSIGLSYVHDSIGIHIYHEWCMAPSDSLHKKLSILPLDHVTSILVICNINAITYRPKAAGISKEWIGNALHDILAVGVNLVSILDTTTVYRLYDCNGMLSEKCAKMKKYVPKIYKNDGHAYVFHASTSNVQTPSPGLWTVVIKWNIGNTLSRWVGKM